MALPVFELIVNPTEESDVEVQAVALVDKPAIEKNFLAFKDQKVSFTTIPDQQIIYGPAMIPDTLIYRKDDQGEYNVFFSKETISQIALKFFKKGYEKNINLFHDQSLTSESVTIFQSFISSKEMGIKPMKGYEDLPEGTWFIGAKVEDPRIWGMVLDGTIKGFSVEGIFSYKKKQAQAASKLIEALRETMLDDCLFTETESSMIAQMIADFKQKFFGPAAPPAPAAPAPAPAPNPEQALRVDLVLKDGTAATADKLEPGGVMMVGDAPCAPGEYELQDGGKVYVGDGGVITQVDPAPGAPDMNAQYQSRFDEIAETFRGYESRFQQYEQKFAETESKLNKANETIVALVGIVEKLSEMPTADPVGGIKNNFQSDKAKSKEQARQELIATLNNLKK